MPLAAREYVINLGGHDEIAYVNERIHSFTPFLHFSGWTELQI
jgi:hypothetical protein